MPRWFTSVALLLAPTAVLAGPASAPSQSRPPITLLAPLGNLSSISPNGNGLFSYFTDSLQWLQEVAVGMVMLWLVFSGIMIMISGNDQGKRTQAKEHAIAAIIGLLMLFLFGFLLSVLNANFFRQ